MTIDAAYELLQSRADSEGLLTAERVTRPSYLSDMQDALDGRFGPG